MNQAGRQLTEEKRTRKIEIKVIDFAATDQLIILCVCVFTGSGLPGEKGTL